MSLLDIFQTVSAPSPWILGNLSRSLHEIRRLTVHRYRLALHLRLALVDAREAQRGARDLLQKVQHLEERNEALQADLVFARGETLGVLMAARITVDTLQGELDSIRAQACLDSQLKPEDPA